jgi:hypothetical protein
MDGCFHLIQPSDRNNLNKMQDQFVIFINQPSMHCMYMYLFCRCRRSQPQHTRVSICIWICVIPKLICI